eukprot:TRINITY_DN13391_c0_g1_i1.p1 TRINITY_DN13391_c0_g1~~TRINITY_DN13391_c0_g1_i1.p1  ORF type:complete len:189 (+),score=30.21 TRINITY_DN13391_c0_g1_i1:58-567(+)
MASASRTPAPRDRASAQGGGSRLRSATHTVGRGAAHSSCRLLAVSSTTARRSTTPTVGRRGVLAVSTGVHGIQQVLERPRPGGSASSGRWARVAFMGGWDRDDCESDEDVCVSQVVSSAASSPPSLASSRSSSRQSTSRGPRASLQPFSRRPEPRGYRFTAAAARTLRP